jgi:hypothetical protein
MQGLVEQRGVIEGWSMPEPDIGGEQGKSDDRVGEHPARAKDDTILEERLDEPAWRPDQQERGSDHQEDEMLKHVRA